MKELWKAMVITGVVLGIGCFLTMYGYLATKSVVITEEHDLRGDGNLDSLTQTILEEKIKYDFIVLINAAHGGENKGNVVNDLQEKTITLEVGYILEEFSAEKEIGIFMIRQKDMNISNESRAQLIENICPDMVIDLHVNADPSNERTLGTSVLYNDRFYRPDLTNAALADLMERSLVTAIEGKALGIFGDTEGKYPLLRMVQVPAVSVEMGYLTNKQEAELLGQESYQERIALGLYNGIIEARQEIRRKK